VNCDLPLFRITDHRAGLTTEVSLPGQRAGGTHRWALVYVDV